MEIIVIKSFGFKDGSLQFDFINESNQVLSGSSNSEIVQATLITAFLGQGRLQIEFENNSAEIRRVLPFNVSVLSSRNFKGDYCISRLATQRVREVGDHLEIFIKTRRENNEIAYNVNDSALQKLLIASFMLSTVDKYNLYLVIDDKTIKSASIGKKLE
jgi:hypothetical protein